jgi:glycosyltransferase involved in cell wall biosynthesis
MSNPVTASIIISSYNYGRFLSQAIDSALNQTCDQVEVIAVDDGSTDNSLDVIASYGDSIISVVKENGGQASALNAGFHASHGQVLLFLDSDDTLLPGAVE